MLHRSSFIAAATLFATGCFDFAGLKAGGGVDAAADLPGRDLTFVFQGCSNNTKDVDESDVDCGGPQCPRCADGKTCTQPADCASNRCEGNLCAPPPASCMDQMKSGDESDIDCGGMTCPKCSDGKACNQATDCTGGACTSSLCGPPDPSCNDNQKNGQESDVDCGGPKCPKCALGKSCSLASDCASGACSAGKCMNMGPLKKISFAVPVTYNIAKFYVGHVLPADMNGDGKADLVAAFGASLVGDPGLLAVFLGKGDGTFAPPQTVATRLNPIRLVVADLNLDKRPDVAVVRNAYENLYPDGLGIFLGKGDGSLQNLSFSTTTGVPTNLYSADFNNDGKVDLLVDHADPHYKLALLLGNGDATFQPPLLKSEGNGRSPADLIDLNGDKQLDFVIESQTNPPCRIRLGKPGPDFGMSTSVQQCTIASALGDYDNDGTIDIVASQQGSLGLWFNKGNGDGTFVLPLMPAPGSDNQMNGVAADLNFDGKLDVAFTHRRKARISVSLGRGNGGFEAPLEFPSLAARDNGPRDLALADLNRDGKLDLVYVNDTASSIVVVLNTSQ